MQKNLKPATSIRAHPECQICHFIFLPLVLTMLTSDLARSIYLGVIILLLVVLVYFCMPKKEGMAGPEGVSRTGYVYTSGASMRHLTSRSDTGSNDEAGKPDRVLVVSEPAVEKFESDPLIATHEESLQQSLYAA